MGFLDKLKRGISGGKEKTIEIGEVGEAKRAGHGCSRMVNTDAITLEMKDLSLETSEEKGLLNKDLLHSLSDILRFLDNIQYNLCVIANRVEDPESKNVIIRSRMSAIELISNAKSALYACVSNPKSEQIQRRTESVLTSIISNASDTAEELLPTLNKEALHTTHDNFPINFSYKDDEEARNVIESLRSIGEISSSLSKSFPELNTGKKYFSGNIEIKLTQRAKKYLDVDVLSKRIKDIAGVVDVWFSDGKSFDMLVEIEVSDHEEAQDIETKIKSISGIKTVEMLLETEYSKN
jgi:Lrp/AsnC ligand binding domain